MTQRSRMPILWVDDDGPRRFAYEQRLLENEGWELTWADGVAAAVDALAQNQFLAVLLDQTLPMRDPVRDRANVWQGCLLLYWLRGKPFPSEVPQIGEWQAVGQRPPHEKNRKTKMIFVSGYYDHDVDAAIRAIEPDLISIVKPIDASALVEALRRLRPK